MLQRTPFHAGNLSPNRLEHNVTTIIDPQSRSSHIINLTKTHRLAPFPSLFPLTNEPKAPYHPILALTHKAKSANQALIEHHALHSIDHMHTLVVSTHFARASLPNPNLAEKVLQKHLIDHHTTGSALCLLLLHTKGWIR